MKNILIIVLLFITNIATAQQKELSPEARKFINQKMPSILEDFHRTKLREYNIPLFKIATRFQGTSLMLANKKSISAPISYSMFDIQFMRFSPLFGIFRFFVQTPMGEISLNEQKENQFLASVNNITIGIAGGGGWYLFDFRRAATGTGSSMHIALLGFWSIPVANNIQQIDTTMQIKEKYSNGGMDINLRFEHNFHHHFGVIVGFDIGFSTLNYTQIDSKNKSEQTFTGIVLNYGGTIGFTF